LVGDWSYLIAVQAPPPNKNKMVSDFHQSPSPTLKSGGKRLLRENPKPS